MKKNRAPRWPRIDRASLPVFDVGYRVSPAEGNLAGKVGVVEFVSPMSLGDKLSSRRYKVYFPDTQKSRYFEERQLTLAGAS